jgi:hypothetical protein
MKVFTIEKCGECPAYLPDPTAYLDDYGICGRKRTIEVTDYQEPPETCPLRDWRAWSA